VPLCVCVCVCVCVCALGCARGRGTCLSLTQTLPMLCACLVGLFQLKVFPTICVKFDVLETNKEGHKEERVHVWHFTNSYVHRARGK